MKQILIILITLISNISFGQVHVRGYFRSNGTYVQPHERTRPNSTITDNYSYQGNYNPNTYTTTPTPNYNNSSTSTYSTNSNSNNRVWVNGYYRTDGTFVGGYYRSLPSTNYSNEPNTTRNNYSTPTYQYVKSKKVNVRRYPSLTSDVCITYEWNQSVRVIKIKDNWAQIEFSKYNNYTNAYENTYGYIKSRLLNYTYNTEYPTETFISNTNSLEATNSKISDNNYTVKSNRAYFHNKPDSRFIRKGYLLYGEKIISLDENEYYIYIVFTNTNNQTSKGWIRKDDLELK